MAELLQLLAAHDAHLVVVLDGDVVLLAGGHDLDQARQAAAVHRYLHRFARHARQVLLGKGKTVG